MVTVSGASGLTNAYQSVMSAVRSMAVSGASRWLAASAAVPVSTATRPSEVAALRNMCTNSLLWTYQPRAWPGRVCHCLNAARPTFGCRGRQKKLPVEATGEGSRRITLIASIPPPRWCCAAVCGGCDLASAPALASGSWKTALLHGALFGLVAYATYDLTNLATLRDWPVALSVVDLLWGTGAVGGTAATAGYLITRSSGLASPR